MLGVSIVLFVVLLAVLFAVAAVTAGFGDLMQPVFQDARPVGLPEAPVGPDDLDMLRFNVVLRGYKMAEVDAVLRRMARELAERDAVLGELRGGQARSFRPEPPTEAPHDAPTEPPYEPPYEPLAEAPSSLAYDDDATEAMAPFVDPHVDTDEHPAVQDAPADPPADAPADPPLPQD